jgi:hypothetical protein
MARFGIVVAVLVLAAGAQAQTNVTVGKMTVDGQEVRELKCNLKKAGFLAVATVVGALSKQKKALDACVPGGAAFRVEWKWDGAGKAKDVAVAQSSAKGKDKCVAAAVAKTTASAEGACSAIILVGKSEAAGKAADALK